MTPIYERTIVGTWLLGFMLVMAALMAAVILLAGDSNEGWWTPLILLAMPLVFGVMRVSVGRDSLRVRFWLGVPRRTVPVERIDGYAVTRSRRETGFGVALRPLDGKFCISGPSAVSILLRNGRTLLVGTPDPEALVKALDRARRRHAREE